MSTERICFWLFGGMALMIVAAFLFDYRAGLFVLGALMFSGGLDELREWNKNRESR